jgi:hypothetical protein
MQLTDNTRFSGNEDFDGIAATRTRNILSHWRAFERASETAESNEAYFTDSGFDFDNYYKSKNMNADIKAFFPTT